MLKIIDLVYYSHNDHDKPQLVLERQQPSIGFADYINGRANLEFIRHMNYTGKQVINGIPYSFFKRSNVPWQIPFRTHRYIKSRNPDVIIVHGFLFPLQVIALRMSVGKRCRIILQHHADQPAVSVRRSFQRIADRSVDAYIFTSLEFSKAWIEQKVISGPHKCFAMLGASTTIKKKDKLECRAKLDITGTTIFLWVGRLNANKDPLTVVKGFRQHLFKNKDCYLYMIFQTDDLLKALTEYINSENVLKKHVKLVGKVAAQDLAAWYSSADIYISGSHSESSGYALLEAMHCGCIPVVTDIPSFNVITSNGEFGFLYQAGNANGLASALNKVQQRSSEELTQKILDHAKNKLGFKNAADSLLNICEKLVH